MKPFMKTCYKCKVNVKKVTVQREGVALHCLRCPQCKEEYYTSSELLRFDVLTGRNKLVRKFGTLGDSTIMRVPPKILHDYQIKPGDYAVFEEHEDGILIKPFHAKYLKP